jgi:hypothetical protein
MRPYSPAALGVSAIRCRQFVVLPDRLRTALELLRPVMGWMCWSGGRGWRHEPHPA